jgi:hypothetical protein
MFQKGPWLGQVPLVLGPSSWGSGMIPTGPAIPAVPTPVPPYYGEWGVVDEATGNIAASGRVGPYNTIDEAFNAAAEAAHAAGAEKLPTNGFAQVRDSRGQAVGPVT